MDAKAITDVVTDFVRAHRTTFSEISARQSQLLELAAVVAFHAHYCSNGYGATARGADPGTFVVKTGTRGHPARYSRIVIEKDDTVAEIHMNVLVRSAHDEGVYCVDVGVTVAGAIPESPSHKEKWICVDNDSLLTFAEVKRLVIYPMLFAQFLGIVHEIKPSFLHGPAPLGFDRHQRLPPTLIALGHYWAIRARSSGRIGIDRFWCASPRTSTCAWRLTGRDSAVRRCSGTTSLLNQRPFIPSP